MPIKTLGGIVAFTNADNCADAADELYAHGGEGSPPGLLIVLVDDPDAPQAGPAGPTTGSARQTKPGPAKYLGLPTALSAQPPARASVPPAAAGAALAATAVAEPQPPSEPAAASVPQAAADVRRRGRRCGPGACGLGRCASTGRCWCSGGRWCSGGGECG